MGNLLTRNQSFDWTDAQLQRGELLENFNSALIAARSADDNIFCTPSLYEFDKPWGKIFEFLWSDGIEYDKFKQRYQWISPDQFRILFSLPDMLTKTTPERAIDYPSLFKEFPSENNSLIGTYEENTPNPLVYNYESWRSFHEKFVASFDFDRRRAEYSYFIKYFKPALSTSLNNIEQIIRRGNAHESIDSIHPPLIGYEKIHIHFVASGNCALNIDGTWKHEVKNFRIERRACEILSEWGFLLPKEYYI